MSSTSASHSAEIINRVASYYSGKLQAHGASPQGVDWNGKESQWLRFKQLSRVLDRTAGFSLLDYGCGYAALYDYIASSGMTEFRYTGLDASEAMIAAAKERISSADPSASWCLGSQELADASFDFVVASGVLNVRLEFDVQRWEDYVFKTIGEFDRLSSRGFAFNCLTFYSDADRKRDDLYYPRPEAFFKLCKTKYSRNVSLLHDYDLYEFTILVRKP